ncbi:MAG: hypothetical protein ACRC6V_18605 [Bacteroidales bacterium]
MAWLPEYGYCKMKFDLFKHKNRRDYKAAEARKDKRVLKVTTSQFRVQRTGEVTYCLSVYYPEDQSNDKHPSERNTES